MSIITFHRFLIATAILFCGVFAGWEFLRYSREGGVLELTLGVTFTLLALALIYYLVNLRRFLDRGSAS